MDISLFHLFFIFFYIGLFAVGGGLVAASFMQQILVDKYELLSPEKFYSMLAISESTPGPIGVNLATYCGTELYGPLGGLIITLGEVLPSLIVIMLISRFFMGFTEKPLVKSAFKAMRPATNGMILVALVQVFTLSLVKVDAFKESGSLLALFPIPCWIFYALCLAILFLTKLHPAFLMLAGAVFGIVFL